MSPLPFPRIKQVNGQHCVDQPQVEANPAAQAKGGPLLPVV
jgi:hypothetical protein